MLELKCPQSDCTCEIADFDVEQLMSQENYTKYQQFRFLARLRLEPDCRWCPTYVHGAALVHGNRQRC